MEPSPDHHLSRGATTKRVEVGGPVLVSAVYFLSAVAVFALSGDSNGFVAIWPGSGILLAAVLLSRSTIARRHIICVALASIIANLQFGVALPTAIGYTAVNIAEPLFVVWLLRGRTRRHALFTTPTGLMRISSAALAASLASSALAAVVTPNPSFSSCLSWFLSDLLGMLIITPMAFIGVEMWQSDRRETAGRIIGWLGFVTLSAVASFTQTQYPLLFVPMLALLIAVFRLGALGGATGLVIIAVIGSVATDIGRGPISLIHAEGEAQIVFLQFYLLALFASALPTAALLATRDRLTARLAERNHLLMLAESTAHVGHWRYDIGDRAIFWSNEVFRIHGVQGDAPLSVTETLSAYHVDDRARVSAAIDSALNQGMPFDFSARIVRADRSICHILSRGSAERTPAGKITGIFGMLQDISIHVATEQALEEARAIAERAALQATYLAETDQLTDIANRRKALELLTAGVTTALVNGTELSLAIFDIDHFKQVNDTFGHGVGDAVLRRVARGAAAAIGGAGTVGRLGGEEFVVVLPRLGPRQAWDAAEAVRVAIADSGVTGEPQVSASFGLATLAQRGGKVSDVCDDLMSRADRALYAAKASGRNALCVAA